MTRILTATEAKAKLLSLLDDADAGEEIEITKHGRVVARLVPAHGARSIEGSLAGLATTVGDDESLFSTGVDWETS
jgi:prevent-host-death family protein